MISHEDWYDIKSWPGERWVPQSCCRPIYNSTYELQSAGAKKRNEECAKYEITIHDLNQIVILKLSKLAYFPFKISQSKIMVE